MKRLLIATAFTALALGSMVVGYWTQSRDLPVQSKALEVMGPVYAGGKLLVRWQVFREAACAATKQEIIIDTGSVRWVMVAQHFAQPPGKMGFDNFISQTDLPADIPPGKATLRVVLAYSCNPVHLLWPVVNVIPDIEFTIEPPRQTAP